MAKEDSIIGSTHQANINLPIRRSSIDESRVSDKFGQWLFVPKKAEHYENPSPPQSL